tara:strand:- start:1161 stop:2024 length:864 start_codon:yes stop_codon:yes gene_type:complete
MKILWQVSFRPLNQSKSNDKVQSKFLENIKKFNADITFSITQFDDYGVKKFLTKKKIKKKYFNYPKKLLPKKSKYSNSVMLKNSLNYYIKKNFDYFIFSNSDILISKRIISILKIVKTKDYMGFIYPNTLIKNGITTSSFIPHYGIDFIAFKLSKKKARLFLKLLKDYKQYDWGVIDNFYIAIGEALEMNFENLFKKIKVKKIENKFKDFNENRESQIKSWKKNNNFFKNFLKKNNLSLLYAFGSYYYILFKIFRFKDMDLKLSIIYLRFYLLLPFNLFKKILKIIF